MLNLLFYLLMLVAAYFIGYVGTAWYLGLYRNRFKTEVEHNINMLGIFSTCGMFMYYFALNS